MAPRRSCSSGVPARTKRRGNRRLTAWLAFRSELPTSGASVCASSSTSSSGRRLARAVSTSSGKGAGPSPGRQVKPSADDSAGDSCCHHDLARSRRASAFLVRHMEGSRKTTSRFGREADSSSSHASNTVLPLPRGQWRTTSAGGGMPFPRSTSRPRRSVCSASRPARYGGGEPEPGRKGPRTLHSCGIRRV